MAEELASTSCIKERTQKTMKELVMAVKESNQLPKRGNNYEMLSSFPVFSQLMNVEGDRLVKLLNQVCRQSGVKIQFSGDGTMDEEELVDRLIDVNDSLLERVGNYLDEADGIRKSEELILAELPASTIRTSWNRQIHETTVADDSAVNKGVKRGSTGETKSDGRNSVVRLMGSSRIVTKPQSQFYDSIDNSNFPFRHKLREKHNAKQKGKGNVQMFVDGEQVNSAEAELTDAAVSLHPYKYELDHFEPLPAQLMNLDPQQPRTLEETPLEWITEAEQLQKLCQVLKNTPEFAVDLEHHDYRSFLGLTCLMQISTRTTDYIVDTLALWKHMHLLNDPFSDPLIVKIFHGSNMDVIWLQRDFGIYVVNMFDTGQAMRSLKFLRFSLAYLVHHYLSVDLEKEYQLADWRIRPLPEELVRYARSDTHYLLYCYDMLRNELLQRGNKRQNLLRGVLDQSRLICLQVFEKQLYSEEDCVKFYEKCKQRFNSRQLFALKELYAWRDRTARAEDESYAYVLPHHMLLQIAEVLPKEMSGVLACCSPVPPLVKKEQHELYRIILQAREKPLDSKIERSFSIPKLTQKQELNPLIHQFHDFSHSSREEEIKPLAERLKISDKPDVKAKQDSSSDSPLKTSAPILAIGMGRTLSADTAVSVTSSLVKKKKKKNDNKNQKTGEQTEKKRKKKGKKSPTQQTLENGNSSQSSSPISLAAPSDTEEILVEDWVSPYEQFLLAEEAAREAAELEAKRKAKEDSTATSTIQKKVLISTSKNASQPTSFVVGTMEERISLDGGAPPQDDFPEPPEKKIKSLRGSFYTQLRGREKSERRRKGILEGEKKNERKKDSNEYDPNRSDRKKGGKGMKKRKGGKFGDKLAKTFSFAANKGKGN